MTQSFKEQYAAVRESGAGLIDLSARGRILVSGSDAQMFLNGLITNDMKTLARNSWMPAAFANVQGRLIAAVRVLHREDGYLIDTETATCDSVIKLIERFTLAGDFRVTDLSSEVTTLSLQGRNAAEVLASVLGKEPAEIAHYEVSNPKLDDGHTVTVIRATNTGEGGFDLFVDTTDAQGLRDSLITAGATQIGEEAAETLRIEAGIPRFGLDMDETTIISETKLEDAVSDTKGCYVGQEIIVRIKHRGHVAKKLTGIIFENEHEVEKDAKIFSVDDREIGRVTSTAFSPRLNRTIALVYLKYDYLAAGTNVRVSIGEGEIQGAVAELPFIRGSWYSD
jgi:folate-binding protein YgfZ